MKGESMDIFKKRVGVFGLVLMMLMTTFIIPKTNSIYAEETVVESSGDVWRHFASGTGNNNGNNPALLKSDVEGIAGMGDGALSFTFSPLSTKADTRFGVYLKYQDANNFVFVGVDNSSNWFYEYKVGGSGSYPKLNVTGPQQGEEANVALRWSGKSLYITINGTPVNSGNPYTIDALETLQDKPLYLRAGTYGSALTDILFKDVVIKDGEDNVLAEKGSDTWSLLSTTTGAVYEAEYVVPEIHEVSVRGTVIDYAASPVANAKIQIGDLETTSDENGNFVIDKVPTGQYTLVASKPGLVSTSKAIEVIDSELNVGTLQLGKEEGIDVSAPAEISSDAMTVGIDTAFPRVMVYTMHGALEGRKFYGNTEALDTININGVSVKPTVVFSKSENTATYVMTVKDDANNIDAVITANLLVEDNILTFKIIEVKDNKLVKTIEIPGHGLVTLRDSQANATFAGANMSTNTHKSGDVFSTVGQMAVGKTGYMYAFLSSNSLSAAVWSNSENNVTSDWQRITSNVTNHGTYKAVGLSSTYWTYQKGAEYRKENSESELPCVKVAITGDVNEDATVDWQDGAIAYRDIMKNPLGSELVPDRVAIRIAMNFGSQAQNPFLMTLDNVKKVYLNTDGLGQSILLKGYGSEGHDSGHLNYADVGRRIGGVEDMKTLLKAGKAYGATFGVHVNASETYAESIYFEEARLKKNADGTYSYGWNWLDQGINIDANYDLLHGRAQRFKDFYDALGGAANDLDFIYVDVWGNGQSGDNGTWASAQLAKEILNLNWRVAGEWGYAFAYDSTFQHWAADLTYGGYSLKGVNSRISRFIQNHQKDSWIGDYESYGGAAVNPLLGGYDMKDFEGWQGRNDYKGYIENLFDDNVATKFVQHFKVTNWEDGQPVAMSDNGETYTWTPEMKVTLQSDDKEHKLVIERQSNDISNAGYKLRTMTFDGKKIMNGETYLIPWYWDENGTSLANEDEKLYHWNQAGGTTTWEVPAGWSGSVAMYTLSEDGKENEQIVPIVNGKVTLQAQAKTPYVIHKTSTPEESVAWSEGMHIVDVGFNSGNLTAWNMSGDTSKASVIESQAHNRMLAIVAPTTEVALEQELTDLIPGQQYAVYVGVDNRSDAKAYLEIDAGGKTISNYTQRSIAKNYVQAYAHNNNAATVGSTSYFQNMYVFFQAPSDGSAVTLRLKRDGGSGNSYFDDIRIFENESNMKVSEDTFVQDFEEVPQGIFPFVVGAVEGVSDNRTHLSEYHAPYTQRGWNNKAIDDVIAGDWSLKTNGLVQAQKIVYQTIPQNYRFEPGVTYNVSFDYEIGTTGTYGVVVGDGEYKGGLDVVPLTETVSGSGHKTFKFRITGSQSGQTWFGIYSTDKAADNQDASGKDAVFRGYQDIILDNLVIAKSTAQKADLEALYDAHKDLYEANYEPTSWETFQSAMDAAKVVLDDLEATQQTVDAAKAELETAIAGLQVVGGVVQGIIKDTEGTVLRDIAVRIKVNGTWLTATTDSKGAYLIAGVGFATWDMEAESPYFTLKNENVTMPNGESVVTKNIVLERANSAVKGKVTAVGLEMEGATVTLSDGVRTFETQSDAHGNYAFDTILASNYGIVVRAQQSGYDVATTTLDAQKNQEVVKNIMLEPESTYDYMSDFEDGTTTWEDLAGNTSSTTIKVEHGETIVKFPGGHANVYDSAAPTFKNGVLEMDVTAIKDSARLGVLLRAKDMNNRVYVGTLENSSTWFVEYWGSGGNAWSSGYAGPSISANQKVHIKVEIVEKTVKLWVNDQFVLETTMSDMQLDTGAIGLNTRNTNEVAIDNVKVTSYDEPTTAAKTVAGHISDAGNPAVDASVELIPVVGGISLLSATEKQVKSDANGNYKFKNVTYGYYTVKVDYQGDVIEKQVKVEDVDGYIVVEEVKFHPVVEPEVIDKSRLATAIDAAEQLNQAHYTAASWEPFTATLQQAKVIHAKADASQLEVNQAESDLTQAQAQLKLLTKAQLKALITLAQVKHQGDYTEDSWQAFAIALQKAMEVHDDGNATEAEIETAISTLDAALTNLVLKKTTVAPTSPERVAVKGSIEKGVASSDVSNANLYSMLGIWSCILAGYLFVKRKKTR